MPSGLNGQSRAEKVHDKLQAEVNTFYDLFVETVAAGRRALTAKAIRDTEAGTFMGAEALELGLIDALGTFEGALAELSSTVGPSTRRIAQEPSATMTPARTAVAAAALATARGTHGHRQCRRAGRQPLPASGRNARLVRDRGRPQRQPARGFHGPPRSAQPGPGAHGDPRPVRRVFRRFEHGV